jgi:hypothetical protein
MGLAPGNVEYMWILGFEFPGRVRSKSLERVHGLVESLIYE